MKPNSTPMEDRMTTAIAMILLGGLTSGLVWLLIALAFKPLPIAFAVASTGCFCLWGWVSPAGCVKGLGAVWRGLAKVFTHGGWV